VRWCPKTRGYTAPGLTFYYGLKNKCLMKHFLFSLLFFIASVVLLIVASYNFSLIALFSAIGCFMGGVYYMEG